MYKIFSRFLLSLGLFMIFGFFTSEYEVQASENLADNISISDNDTGNINDVDDKIEGYEKYVIDVGETAVFDLELAIENNESSEMIIFGEVFNSLAKESSETPNSEYEFVTFGIIDRATRYGNWCGRGNNGKAPLDVLDLACMAHDQCYDRTSYGNASCDRAFVNRLKNIRENGYSPRLGVYARVYLNAAIAYFS